jgi:hypothetical protein
MELVVSLPANHPLGGLTVESGLALSLVKIKYNECIYFPEIIAISNVCSMQQTPKIIIQTNNARFLWSMLKQLVEHMINDQE